MSGPPATTTGRSMEYHIESSDEARTLAYSKNPSTPESLWEAALRLQVIAEDVCRRFDAQGMLVAPLNMPNNIAAMRLILDRLEQESAG